MEFHDLFVILGSFQNVLIIIEGLRAKRAYVQVFGRFSFFRRIELIFHRLTCFDMEHIVP